MRNFDRANGTAVDCCIRISILALSDAFRFVEW